MNDVYPDAPKTVMGRLRHSLWIAWMFIAYLFDRAIVYLGARLSLVVKEIDLFAGAAFFIIGILGFESGRYCDGNSAEYLSCTRPATFYFYDAVHTALIVLGIFLIIVWFLKRSHAAR
jgi:hypothetical protein